MKANPTIHWLIVVLACAALALSGCVSVTLLPPRIDIGKKKEKDSGDWIPAL